MAFTSIDTVSRQSSAWLRGYYFTRFAFSAAWVALAFSVAKDAPALAGIMLIAYPAWDAVANFVDAQRSGGLGRNQSQLLNVFVSGVAAVAVAIALGRGMQDVLFVFGIWAALSGVFQLATGLRRWKSAGAQWAMILSGAQSVLAGVFMVKGAGGTDVVSITSIAPYAAFGAFYFLVSAIWLLVSNARRPVQRPAL